MVAPTGFDGKPSCLIGIYFASVRDGCKKLMGAGIIGFLCRVVMVVQVVWLIGTCFGRADVFSGLVHVTFDGGFRMGKIFVDRLCGQSGP